MINRTNIGYDNGKNCEVTFTVDEDMEAPVYVYYQLDNFYQNHRRYVKSLSFEQLRGIVDGETGDCDPLTSITTDDVKYKLNPCGLIANSLFNDVITSETATHPMTETGIAWDSDVEEKFKQPKGFKKKECVCGAVDCVADATYDCGTNGTPWVDPTDSTKCWLYTYPDDETTQYLYESYPMVVDPIDGVKNEHFIVWMRTAGLPTFRKLYGIIDTDIAKGETVTFKISPNFAVSSFKGKKSLVLSTVSWFGGKNPFLGQSYIVVGTICLALALGFGIKHMVNPRKLGDTRYLVWKDA